MSPSAWQSKKTRYQWGVFGDGIWEDFAIVGSPSENHKVTIATIKITSLLVGTGLVATW
jgi:hypothetical protein